MAIFTIQGLVLPVGGVIMFNGKLKKEAMEVYKLAYEEHEKAMKNVVTSSEKLQSGKILLKKTIDITWEYLNGMKNKPENLIIIVEKIRVEFKKFENAMHQIQLEFDSTLTTSTGIGAAGAAAGAGVAAFGPSAAMAVAMTFGTASTGTAISALSGAAATNAALAWLGGGAIIAGGGGMSAGSAFLALAGPVGWVIGGTAFVGAGLFARSKNKKVAEETFKKAKEIKSHTKSLEAIIEEINKTYKLVENTEMELRHLHQKVYDLTVPYNHDVQQFSNDKTLLSNLLVLINNTKSAAELINRPIGVEA